MISYDERNDVPWIRQRLNKNTLPTHVILSQQLHLETEPTLTLHTAGQLFLWEITLRDAAINHAILDGMTEEDRQLVKWLYENDYGDETPSC
ncbi:MAG: hypothetical protein NTW94_03035 [Legionellales bacterium]|nr:hypothetical protein [Legionellales bacterium]